MPVTKGGAGGKSPLGKNFTHPGKIGWFYRCKTHAIDVTFGPPSENSSPRLVSEGTKSLKVRALLDLKRFACVCSTMHILIKPF